MRVLMVAPPTGGIDTYVKRLEQALEDRGVAVNVDGARKDETAFNISKKCWKSSAAVKRLVRRISRRIEFENYDIVAFHYGKNDIEQYLPVILNKQRQVVPNPVYFVHYLSRNLFSEYLNDPLARVEVEKQVGSFYKGYVFFGTFAKEFMEKQYRKQFKGIVTFLPETHAHEVLSNANLKRLAQRFIHPIVTRRGLPFVACPGFPAHYKDYHLLLKALEEVSRPLALLFAGFGWEKQLKFSEKKIGKSFVYCVDKYLNSKEYAFLVRQSLFGVFPYSQPDNPEERFQGSGTLPNFIYEGKAPIVLNGGTLPEYVGDAGIILSNKDPESLAAAIESLLEPRIRRIYERKAIKRRSIFSISSHAKRCLSFFQDLLKEGNV